MPRPSSRSVRLGPGQSVIPLATGSFQAYYRPAGGVTQRRAFPTLDGAQRWLTQMSARGPLPPLDAAQYADAQRAVSLLPPGATLEDAARALARSVAADRSPPLRKAAEEFLSARSPSLTESSAERYRWATGALAAAFPGRSLGSLSPEDVEAFVGPRMGATRNSLLKTLSPLFSFGVERGWIERNPVSRVARARKVEPPLGVLTPEQAAQLLALAEERRRDVVALIALGLFAGLRPSEAARLPADAVRNGFIVLDGKITKTGRARTVPVRPNLAAWLSRYRPEPMGNRRMEAAMSVLRAALPFPWPHDALRHSFATYAYERIRDAAAVAAEMGLRGTDVFFHHYRALAQPGDGRRFFAIYPAAP